MRLKTRLLRGYILLAALTSVVAFIGLYFMRDIDHQMDALSQRATPAVTALNQIKSAAHEMCSSTYSLSLTASSIEPNANGERTLVERSDRIELARDDMNQWLAQYALVADPTLKKTFLTEAKAYEMRIAHLGKSIINDILKGSDQKRLLQHRAEFDENRDEFFSLINRSIAIEMRRVRTHEKAADERIAMALIAAIAMIIVVFVAATILSLQISSTLIRQLRHLRAGVDNLGPGNFSQVIIVPDAPELNTVAESINQLAVRMGNAEHANKMQYDQLHGEIGKRKQTEAQLLHEATHDALTGLANRVQLIQDIESCLERAHRNPDFKYALLFLDLDRFKVINDSLGHNVGDELLVESSQRLIDSVRGMDTVIRVHKETTARLGGDEFAILLDGIKNPGRAILIAERIQERLSKTFHLSGNDIVLSTSIGIAIGDSTYQTASDLIRDADTAMYRAKQAGGAQHAVFDDVMHAEVKLRLQLENDLRKAVEAHQFEVAYQPIVELSTGMVTAFEALIRWNHPERGKISPTEFIPIAEETGLIAPIGRWVLQESTRQLMAWRRELPDDRPLSMSVNVSPRQVGEANIVQEVRRTLKATGLDPRWLRLEITESMIMENAASIHEVLSGLKDIGVELHMDDFGTGYSSLSYLHKFPLDVLKIDREFVTNIGTDPEYAAVVKAIMTLAHSLRMKVTAEGIETPEQLALVRSLGCNYGQGYIFSRPLDPANAWKLLSNDEPLRQSA
ncbi:MAG: EAL domain-containing protein [Planctomycetota bacterium]